MSFSEFKLIVRHPILIWFRLLKRFTLYENQKMFKIKFQGFRGFLWTIHTYHQPRRGGKTLLTVFHLVSFWLVLGEPNK